MSKVKEKQKQKRKEIIESITPLLMKTSINDLSIKEICKEINLSIGAFYHYFEKKDDLKICYVIQMDESFAERVFPMMNHYDEIENLRVYIEEITKGTSEMGVQRAKLVTDLGSVEYDMEGNLRPSFVKLRETMFSGQRKGQITAEYDATELADVLFTAVQGLGIEWVRRNGTYSLEEKMKKFADIFLEGLKKQSVR